jgi:hypothetical protein
MTKKQPTKKGGSKGKGRGSKKAIRARVDADAKPAQELAQATYVETFKLYLNNPDEATDLLTLLSRLDAGETLAGIAAADEQAAAEAERAADERAERRKAEICAKPEPKDKTRDAWRIWKLRRIEADFRSGDTERYGAAWREFRSFLHDFDRDNRATVNKTLALLPTLIMGYQNEVKEATRPARSAAARNGAQTRAARKGKGASRRTANARGAC